MAGRQVIDAREEMEQRLREAKPQLTMEVWLKTKVCDSKQDTATNAYMLFLWALAQRIVLFL